MNRFQFCFAFIRVWVSIFLTAGCLNSQASAVRCAQLFSDTHLSEETLATRTRVFKARKIRTTPANSFYMHQVLGVKASDSIPKKQWLSWFLEHLTQAQALSSVARLEKAWLETSYQSVIWATKGRVYTAEDKTAIQVTLSFKKDYVFIDSYDVNKFVSPDTAFQNYGIAGLHDKANNFYKIASLQGIEKIVIFDPETKLSYEYLF